MNISVLGTGYLGATHAACMAELGFSVVGVDIDEDKIAALSAGRAPFYEPGLGAILRRAIDNDRLRFSTDMSAAAQANVHFIAVGTPQAKGSFAADTSAVEGVLRELVPHLEGEHVVIGKSTVPVGTAARLQKMADDLAGDRARVEVCWNPEFLREGYAVHDTITPDRIVLGMARPDSSARAVVENIYAQALEAGTPLIVTDLATAELVKVAANAFLATKISFINAVSEVCEVAGADITDVADALGYDNRIGRRFLNAGLGFGGGCLPKDIRAFMARAGELGANEALTFLREVDAINMRRRDHLVQVVKRACGGSLIGQNIAVLGCAFKPHSDDVRDSPSLAVAGALSLGGAEVSVYDPQAMDNARAIFPTLHYSNDAREALAGADCVVLATEWPEFMELDPREAAAMVRTPRLVDGRNVMDRQAWAAAGWSVHALGRPSLEPGSV
ncbi:UDP-glucose/GDP-mannose dehydrogenase family protein [Corynebacterium sp. TAE3-ERU2]|uniref:UDP-glucose dehydrogenase family protein n=1 Tax=Corynebacterium sp. TAE3-ERU2 TaxID=2849497 RepID=UPI001C44D7EB|nr:UDP-glucose/GDP-mannose dehydrogenase family protein [Corynebacterium sp. TAE3-ERU2]MBV7302162.1 UDP-glucose/GDP-mannose dehydrogenase family protein [Corynebacterium sp. TAE3-ERU2]